MLLQNARKVVVFVFGTTVVMIGIAGLVLPIIPGMVLIPVGIAILATEFIWARHLLKKVKATTKDVLEAVGVGNKSSEEKNVGPDPAAPSDTTSQNLHP